jgi:hypothetical protein
LIMKLDSEYVNTVLRLQVLPGAGQVFEARVESVAGKRFLVKCECALKVGAAVQLDAPDRMLLGEVLAFDRGADGSRALVDVQHSLLYADLDPIRSRWGAPQAPDARAGTAGA